MHERKDMREKIIETKIYLDVKLETKRWGVGNYELQSVYRQHATNLALHLESLPPGHDLVKRYIHVYDMYIPRYACTYHAYT